MKYYSAKIKRENKQINKKLLLILTDVMEEIKVEILYLELFELLFEDLLHFRHVGNVIPGELRGKIKA